jgi:hypothetical protein
LLPLNKVVFNTEAHPFPNFKLGPLFKTGWKRKPRGADGKIITDEVVKKDEAQLEPTATHVTVQTKTVLKNAEATLTP